MELYDAKLKNNLSNILAPLIELQITSIIVSLICNADIQ